MMNSKDDALKTEMDALNSPGCRHVKKPDKLGTSATSKPIGTDDATSSAVADDIAVQFKPDGEAVVMVASKRGAQHCTETGDVSEENTATGDAKGKTTD